MTVLKVLNLQPRNYQDSKEVVHEPEFGAVAVMQLYLHF